MINTIIICDKNNAERTQCASVFRARGSDVIAVNSSLEVLVKAAKYDPDVIIVSFSNTEIDYLDVVKSVKFNDKVNHIPVLMMFNLDHPAFAVIMQEGQKIGVDGYLFKPLDMNLAAMIVRDLQYIKGHPNRKKILVADDHQSIRDALTYSLTKEGYNVFIAENGRDAYEKAKCLVPDLIIMDYSMPECNGLYSAKRIKALPYLQHIPIVGHTSVVTADIIAKSVASGCVTVIKKPTPVTDIISKINALVKQSV